MPFLIIYLVIGGIIVPGVISVLRKEWQQLDDQEKERRELYEKGYYVALRLAQLQHKVMEDKMAVLEIKEVEHMFGRRFIICGLSIFTVLMWLPIAMIIGYKKWTKVRD
jgi:hypothetical protein